MTSDKKIVLIGASILTGSLVGGVVGFVTLSVSEPNLGSAASWFGHLWLFLCGAIGGLTIVLSEWSLLRIFLLCVISGGLPFLIWIFTQFQRIMDNPFGAFMGWMQHILYATPTILISTAFIQWIFLPIIANNDFFKQRKNDKGKQ